MIDRTQEDMNQDLRLARIQKRLDDLTAKVTALEAKLAELAPVINFVERIEQAIGRVENLVKELLGEPR